MVGKLGKALVLVVVVTMLTTGVVFAEDETSQGKLRRIGEITGVDLEATSFTLHTLSGEDLRFIVTERTRFRSRNGAIEGIEDLSIGMKAFVSAVQDTDGDLIALLVAAGEANELPELRRSSGTIVYVNLEENSFLLAMKNGKVQKFDVGPRTRYKSRDGSVNGLSDIDPGMLAVVVALDREDQTPLALWVGVTEAANRRERFTVIGEITNVVPGQGTFELEARSGKIFHFSITEETKFRSRDGSIEDIHDLKKGMHALVVGFRNREGSLIALGIAAGYVEDLQGISEGDIRPLGRIISLGNQSFTIEGRNQ